MSVSDYIEFLKGKIVTAEDTGFDVADSEISGCLKPHQRDAVKWAVKGGKRALFESFGLGKTLQQLEILRLIVARFGGKALIVCPLGVRQEFKHDAELLLKIKVDYVRTMAEVEASGADIVITNYERVRDGDINPKLFTATSLDEASVLRSFGSLTYQTFLHKFQGVQYKFVCTATPSPNKYKELIHYAGYLEVMDTGQALTRFFQRDSTKANNLTIYPHKEEEFWLWVSTWAVFITKPSDLGYPDEGYDLPPLKVIYHEVPVDHLSGPTEKDGQAKLFRDAAEGLKEASREKRDSIEKRIERIDRILYDLSCINSLNTGGANDTGREKTEETGILRQVVCGESGACPCQAEGAGQEKLSGKSRGLQGEVEKVEIGASGGNEGPSAKVPRGKQRQDTAEIEGLVREEQGPRSGSVAQAEGSILWPNDGGVQCSTERAGRGVRDLRKGQPDSQKEEATHRPLPRDQRGEGTPVPPLQRGAGSVQGRSGAVAEGYSLPEQVVIWCDLNDEQKVIESLLKSRNITFSSIYGHQSPDEKERLLLEWRERKACVLLSKTEMLGSGTNLQQACKMIFAGIDYKFNGFVQGIHRVWRFLQVNPVEIHIIYTESERAILETLLTKWKQHDHLVENMIRIIKQYGLSTTSVIDKLARKIGVERVKIEGRQFTAVNNDCVIETSLMEENSIDLIHTSIPFANHYEYTPSYNDFGHTNGNAHFWQQMDFLTPQLHRILKPGRIAAIHVKDRIMFGNATGDGMPTCDSFHEETSLHFQKHGFRKIGMITVVTDVVRENNQTYRLGWSEQCKDGSKMGVGCPEYILLFRKLPSDTSRAYADDPVQKSKDDYTRAQWQIDAHAFWRSSGNRLVRKEELADISVSDLQRVYRGFSRDTVYSYEDHVQLAKDLDENDKLPATFMVVAPGSWEDTVWDDINRMRTLNGEQVRRNVQMHVCPLQFDIVERIINRYSNSGDVVFDPFGGIGTVPYMAIKAGRKGYMTELNNGYFRDAVGYLKAAEQEADMPSLFDLMGAA